MLASVPARPSTLCTQVEVKVLVKGRSFATAEISSMRSSTMKSGTSMAMCCTLQPTALSSPMSLWSLDISATTTVLLMRRTLVGERWNRRQAEEGGSVFTEVPSEAASSSAAPKQEVRSKKMPKKKPAEGSSVLTEVPTFNKEEIKKLIIEAELEEARKAETTQAGTSRPYERGEGSPRPCQCGTSQGRRTQHSPATSFYESVVSVQARRPQTT